MLKILKYLVLFCFLVASNRSFAQNPACSPTGNLLIFSNYDGGELNINIDQNIPNLKIGVCTYEPVRITISGPFASNVSQVLYAGFNSVQNNNNCNIGNFPTSIIGVPLSNQSILTVPPVTLNNPSGSNFGMVCGYSCDVNTNQGGCNTIDQIEDYFITQLGGTLYSLNAQYCCWLDSYTYQVSQLAGSCCNSIINTITLTSALGTDNQTVCINNPIGGITYSYNNAIPTLSGLPNGVNYTINNGVVTISGTPTTAGSFNYTLSIPGNCGNVQTITGTILVNDYAASTIVANACGTYTAPWGTVYTQSGTYTDTLASLNGCDSVVSVNLNIAGLPTVSASSISATCGLADGTATAAATGGAGNYSYSWSNGATGSFATGLLPGNYVVTATDQNGCASSTQVTVLNGSPTGVSIAANDTCLENSIPFSILTGAPISSVVWNFGDSLSGVNNTSTSLTPSHLFSEPGTYTIRSIVNFSCSVDTIFKTLTIANCDSNIEDCPLYVPNAFTPNNNGTNDAFYPFTFCAFQYYEFMIFNRWGGEVFKTSNPTEKWDGKYKGVDCPSDVYVYLIVYEFPRHQTKQAYGSITLVR